MICPFRYVHAVSDAATNLHMFKTLGGDAYGNVRGAVSNEFNGLKVFDDIPGQPLSKAFATVIRMANRSDTEIEVSGDRQLWNSEWGQLVDNSLAA